MKVAQSFILGTSLLVSSSLISACTMVQKLDDMRDATKNVDATTMRMDKSTEHLDEVINTAVKDIRPGFSLEIRSARLKAMEETEDPIAKASEAAKYFMGFEFQLMNETGSDITQIKREQLYLNAIEEFLADLRRYIRADRDPSPLSKSPRMLNLYALAATIERVNPRGEALSKNEKKVSMMSLLQDGLRKKNGLESGEISYSDLPAYQRIILQEEKDVIYLLRLRANVWPAVVMKDLSGLEDTGFLGIPGFARSAKMLVGDWDADLSETDTAKIRQYSERIGFGLDTIAFLHEIGIDPALDSKILRVYGNMRLGFDSGRPESGKTSRRDAIISLQSAVNDFLGVSKPKEHGASGGW